MNRRWLSLIAGALGATALALPGAAGGSAPEDDPLGCLRSVVDPAGHLDAATVESQLAAAERWLNADVRVRVEAAVDGDLDARLTQLVRQCAGWNAGDGELASGMVVVMYSPTEREAAVYYGADQRFTLDARWEPAVDAMIAALREGDETEAVVEALQALMTSSGTSGSSRSSDSSTDRSGSASGFPIGWVLVLVLVVGGSWTYRLLGGGSGADPDDDPDGSRDGGGRHRHSSPRTRSLFGRSAARRSGGSPGSSSRRSGHAGGGSKHW